MGTGTINPPAPPAADGAPAPDPSPDPSPTTPASGSNRANRKRKYVVIEKTGDGIKEVARVESGTSDDACWEAVEKPGDLNKRAKGEKGEKAPKLLAIPVSNFEFDDYSLQVETVVKRAKKK